MVPGPGSFMPSTAEIKPAPRMPWAIRPPNWVWLAETSLVWAGLRSPVMPANRYTSVSVTVLVTLALSPSFISRISIV